MSCSFCCFFWFYKKKLLVLIEVNIEKLRIKDEISFFLVV